MKFKIIMKHQISGDVGILEKMVFKIRDQLSLQQDVKSIAFTILYRYLLEIPKAIRGRRKRK